MATLAAVPPPRPYRRFLTSSLHKRFVHAALLTLLIAFFNAFCLGPKKDLFWSWFPIGPAGIRALLFFMSSLFIFILQIATLKIGRQTSSSPFAAFRSNFFGGAALQTTFWFLVSGWWFTEAFIWSSSDLGWITRGSHSTPDVLNEKPIFFRLYALVLALAYSGLHLYHGRSSLVIPVSKLPPAQTADVKAQDTHSQEPILSQLCRKAIPAILESAVLTASMMVVTPFLNGLALRQPFWQLHLMLAKPFFNLSRANARPIGYPPLGLGYLAQCTFAGFLMVATWEFTSLLFLTYLNQEPTKSGLPLSASSKDPNGTLVNGLKAKRDVVKTFAFWELAIIAQRHKERRKAIFEDIERPTGPVWSQMVEAGLKVLRDIEVRICGPPPQPAPANAPEQASSLPKIVPQVQSHSIFQPQPGLTMAERLASPLRQIGSSPQPWHPPVEETARAVETKLLEYARPPSADPAASKGLFAQWMTTLQQSPVGWFFNSSKAARINALVLGTPSGSAAVIVDVIDALTKMQVASLSEDTYGKATPTVPETVRTFTKTLTAIEGLLARDKQGTGNGIKDVEIIVTRLRSGLKELLAAFQLYLIDQGLGIADLNQAQRAAEGPAPSLPPQDRPAEPPTRRQLFSSNAQKGKPLERRQNLRSQAEDAPRIEPSRRASEKARGKQPTAANGRPYARREMEQVR